MLCPPLEETSNPVTCYPVAGYPLGCKVSWEPTQEGSGEPSQDNIRPIKGRDSVTVERCGENLLDSMPELPIKIYKDSPKVVVRSGTLPAGRYTTNVKLDVIPSGASLNSALIKYELADGTEKYFVPRAQNETSETFTFATAIRTIAVVNYGVIDGNITGISLVPSTTPPTTYSPYTGQTATLTLPTTIYGGTVDAVTGEGKEMWKLIDSYAGEDLPGKWISDRNVYASGTTPTTGAQVAYILAEPISFTATGAKPIPALSGANTVLTDADSVTVTGRADPIKRITDLEDAVASMTNT